MEENNIKVGDVVRLKTFDMLEEEGFEALDNGVVKTAYGVIPEMFEVYADQYLLVASVSDDRITFEDDPCNGQFTIGMDAVYKVDADMPLQKIKCYDLSKEEMDLPMKYNEEVNVYSKIYSIKAFLQNSLTRLVHLLDIYEIRNINVLISDVNRIIGSCGAADVAIVIDSKGAIDTLAQTTNTEAYPKDYGYVLKGILPFDIIAVDRNANSDVIFTGVAEAMINILNLNIPEAMSKAIFDIDVPAMMEEYNKALISYKDRKKDKMFEEIKEQLMKAVNVKRKQKLENDVADVENKIFDLERDLKILWEALKKSQKELCFFNMQNISTAFLDFMTVLKEDKDNIISMQFRDGENLMLDIKTSLMFFADEDWMYLRDGIVEMASCDGTENLLDAIFERKAVLTFGTQINMYFGSGTVKGPEFSNSEKNNGIPNPHIYFYNCWGDNWPLIIRAMNEGDYVSAYLQIKSALMGLTLTDTSVMEKFVLKELEGDKYKNCRCITDVASGKVMTIEEARDFYTEEVVE